jgi:hypothetical protein
MKLKWLSLVFAFALVGCTDPATEAILSINNAGLIIPDEMREVFIFAYDRSPMGDTPVTQTPVPLCYGSLQSNCYKFLFTAGLVPGPKQPNDTVRVVVEGHDPSGMIVISDTALFKFIPHETVKISFVLYPACINVNCSKFEQACNQDGICEDIGPIHTTTPPDDLAVTFADLASRPDDMAGCMCTGNTVCGTGPKDCIPCGGAAGQPCCNGTGGKTCDATLNLVCGGQSSNNTCVHCGAPGEICCPMGYPMECTTGLICSPGGRCTTPPDMSGCKKSCAANECGLVNDNCGSTINCGVCDLAMCTQTCGNACMVNICGTYCMCNKPYESCGGGGVANQCGCTPDCTSPGQCGGAPNHCGGFCNNSCPPPPDMMSMWPDMACTPNYSCSMAPGVPIPFAFDAGMPMQCIQMTGCPGTPVGYPNARCEEPTSGLCCGESGLPCCSAFPPCNGALTCSGNQCI